MGVGHRGNVSFTGWTLAEVSFDLGKFGRSRLRDGTYLPLYVVGLMIEDCRKLVLEGETTVAEAQKILHTTDD